MNKKIIVLGSTGSIGTQTLEVVEKTDGIEIVSLCCGSNIELLKTQINKYGPKAVCVGSFNDVKELKIDFPELKIYFGEEGLCELVQELDYDMLLVASSGKIGLKPTIEAVKRGKDIAIANKETLVMAGEIVMKLAKEHKINLLPVDSEHSAIHQCISNTLNKEIQKLIITASGGPFLDSTKEEIENSTLLDTLKHPRWKMGKKITVDSATLMNKGLEVIEAHHLFGLNYEKIQVVIHPQSLLHSAVEFIDGSILGQMGLPSMHIPIQYALTYPKRQHGIKTESFSFFNKSLTFFEPDFDKFPALKLALEAGNQGTSHCVVLNAANEVAVNLFLNGKIKLTDIKKIVENELASHKTIQNPSLDDILNLDNSIREKLDNTLCS